MNNLLVLPVLIPLVTAAAALLAWRRREIQRWLAVIGSGLHLLVGLLLLARVDSSGIQALQIGSWPAPFGITLIADLMSAIMVVLAGVIGLSVAIYSLGNIDARREQYGYYPLYMVLLMGISGAFLTGDLFNLYVWFEVMLIASFVLMALGGESQQMEGALKYVSLNLLSSAIFLAAVGAIYGVSGTLNMADLAQLIPGLDPVLVNTLAMMFLVAFGIKAAVFPLFFWLPAAYHTPPAAVSAIFAGMLTKVGVYALVRIFTLIFIRDLAYTHTILLVLAGFTMVTGVLGAASQFDFRRVLSFHIISQIGYLIMGLALFSPLALAGMLYFTIHNILAKTNLFLVSGLVDRLQGSYQLKLLGGLYRSRPALAALFLIPALSLAGLPPLSGFWAKFMLVRAGLELEQYLIVAVALGVSILTLFSMIKIWDQAFWKDRPDGQATDQPLTANLWWYHLSPILFLAALTVGIGLLAEPVYLLAMRAAEQLLDPAAYIATVLGGKL